MISSCLKELCMGSAVLQDCGVRAVMKLWKAFKSKQKIQEEEKESSIYELFNQNQTFGECWKFSMKAKSYGDWL